MVRALCLASLVLVASGVAHGQAPLVLHIKVVVIDSERKAMPVARHVLLVSDEPPSAPPRAIATALDGTAQVRLRPGNYLVESERPVAFEGRVYEWRQRVAVGAGGEAVLELTADNAVVDSAAPAAAASATDPSFLLPQWQGSVLGVWSPTIHASGFLVDASGLIATNQRVIGTAKAAEVQLTSKLKVMARVLEADAERDVAVLWIDPAAAASLRPVPLGCSPAAKPAVERGQPLFTIGVPHRGQKGMTSGIASRVERQSIVGDFRLASGAAGGPVFNADGEVVGITSLMTADELESRRSTSRIVRLDGVCEVIASAVSKMQGLPPPDGTPLPVEPVQPFPMAALAEAAQRRAGSLSPPQFSSADFDVAFVTPVLLYGAREQEKGRERSRVGAPGAASDALRPLREFSNWSEYVADLPPVLLIRVTPKLVEGFWATVARGAARTQGMSLPPIRRFKAGFSKLRAFCGDAEVTPIHPFKLEQRASETEAIYEGLYVFDPGALGPHCATARLMLYSEKEPEKGDTRVIDPKVLQRIWQDFAPYRG